MNRNLSARDHAPSNVSRSMVELCKSENLPLIGHPDGDSPSS